MRSDGFYWVRWIGMTGRKNPIVAKWDERLDRWFIYGDENALPDSDFEVLTPCIPPGLPEEKPLPLWHPFKRGTHPVRRSSGAVTWLCRQCGQPEAAHKPKK